MKTRDYFKRIMLTTGLLLALLSVSVAQKDTTDLKTQIDADLASGSNITATELRSVFTEVVRGSFNRIDDPRQPDTTRARNYASTMTIDYDSTRNYFISLSGHINKLTIDNAIDGSWGTVEIKPNGYAIDTVAFNGYDLTVYETGAAPDSTYIDTSADFLTINWNTTDSAGYVNFPLLRLDTTIFVIQAVPDSTDLTVGTRKVFFMPDDFVVTNVYAFVVVAPTGSGDTIDINESGTTILSTKLTIDATEKKSSDADTAPVISDTALGRFNEITIDVDGVGSSTPGKGLYVQIEGIKQ